MAVPVRSEFDADMVALQSALAGEYSIERELGRGGMAIVYLAREVRLDRLVALKVLPPAFAVRSDLKERFIREARTSAKLSHPNIVPIFRVDEIGGFVFFAMAYVEGETLGQRIRVKGPLPPREAVPLIREVAWALAYAHARGIVHRDVKPDNILIESGTNRALVTDFGIAHVTESVQLTQDGMVMGTAHYMSPEQAAGEPLDGRSDLYSLGVVAYYALSGKLPFDAPSMQALLAMHLTQPPPPLTSANPGVPRSVASAIERCLAKDPAARFQSGEQLAESLAATAVVSREVPAPVRVWTGKGQLMRVTSGIWYFIFILDLVDGDIGWGHLIGFLLPIVAYTAYTISNTRRLLEAGYGLTDLRLGLRAYVEQREEEAAFDVGRDAPLPARIIRDLSYVGIAGAALTTMAVYFWPPTPETMVTYVTCFALSAAAAFQGAVIGLLYPGRRLDPKDRLDQLRIRFWDSRVGEWIAKVSSWKLSRRGIAADAAQRPTELAIGSAADALFDALPKSTRHELRELPDVMRQLESDAQAMRKRIDELSQTLASLESGDAASRSTTLSGASNPLSDDRRSLQSDLEHAKEAAMHRLSATVGALERIRLGLIRLRAGAATTADVTATLAIARRVAEEVEYQRMGADEANAQLLPRMQ